MNFRVGEGPKSRLVRSRRRLLHVRKRHRFLHIFFYRKTHKNNLKMELKIIPKSFRPLAQSTLGPICLIYWTQNTPKIRKNTPKVSNNMFFEPPGINFGGIGGSFWSLVDQKLSQNDSRNKKHDFHEISVIPMNLNDL